MGNICCYGCCVSFACIPCINPLCTCIGRQLCPEKDTYNVYITQPPVVNYNQPGYNQQDVVPTAPTAPIAYVYEKDNIN